MTVLFLGYLFIYLLFIALHQIVPLQQGYSTIIVIYK